jgi:hypothetical protein
MFVGDYVVSGNDDNIRSGAYRFGAVAAPYLAQYVTGGRSIDRVYGIRREADGKCHRRISILGGRGG